ncbi:YhbY family RNA-binding protein [Lacticaseibacillus kribbianus]|uniref:YhbY family RNA-binding protein n=1 Tax=Lacticaseibacillus kribbianus TaxID=2926292 RepID=UPI001CD7B96F|nr:YhbY family RNA-binding protein [Lacticaseibacillus kribbianus]
MLTGKQKRYLRSLAMTQRPLINLGKNGLSDTFVAGVKDALNTRELIKISLLPTAEATAAQTGAYLSAKIPGLEVAQVIGHSLVVFREAEQEADRKLSAELKKL